MPRRPLRYESHYHLFVTSDGVVCMFISGDCSFIEKRGVWHLTYSSVPLREAAAGALLRSLLEVFAVMAAGASRTRVGMLAFGPDVWHVVLIAEGPLPTRRHRAKCI